MKRHMEKSVNLWSRRTVLRVGGALGLAAASGRDPQALAQGATPAAPPSGPVKLVLLYNQPDDPAAFDAYYLGKHVPLASTIPGFLRLETAVVVGTPDASPSPYHRISELLFPDTDAMLTALGSPQGQAALADQANFAQAGAVGLIALVDASVEPGGTATPVS
jgi:uncharacterized protein (TIGR02118 family)